MNRRDIEQIADHDLGAALAPLRGAFIVDTDMRTHAEAARQQNLRHHAADGADAPRSRR